MLLKYFDSNHAYYLDGKRAKGVTTLAKIPTDTYSIDRWTERMVAIGVTVDPTIRENIACHIDNKQRLNDFCEEAKKAAKAHEKADRGTQMHRVLELVLLDQEIKLITDQQRRDAVALKRTLDRYKLTPHLNLTEQFVAWPDQVVCGRFDAVLERPDGKQWLVDLKSGPNAVAYPQSTAVQLALYARAPHVSVDAPAYGDKQEVTDWRTMPENLDYKYARVLLCTPTDDVGTLHRIDIEHGWAGARKALEIVKWRKVNNDQIVFPELTEDDTPVVEVVSASEQAYYSYIASAQSVDDLYAIWDRAKLFGHATETLRVACAQRKAIIAPAMV
jgi:hypothetical protein